MYIHLHTFYFLCSKKSNISSYISFLSIHAYASTLFFSVMYIKFSTSYCRGNLGQVIQSTIWNKYMLLELYFVVYCCTTTLFLIQVECNIKLYMEHKTMQNIWKKRAFQVYSKEAWINDIIWIIHTNTWTFVVEEIYIDFQKNNFSSKFENTFILLEKRWIMSTEYESKNAESLQSAL